MSGVHFEQPYAINAGNGYGATFHVFSLDQGSTWIGRYITHNKTFRGCHDDLCMDNRSQVSTTADGSVLVFSWSDSDFEGVYENILPDIWCQGYDVETQLFTDVFNVTFLSDIWLETHMAVSSPILFVRENGFLIPFALQSIPGGDPVLPVQYRYVSDYSINYVDYILLNVLDNAVNHPYLSVSSIFPNPAREITIIAIELQQTMEVKIEISNLHGQMLYSEAIGVLGSGQHVIQTDVSMFTPGIYFYTISAGDQVQTRKLVVQ
ncbi:MAG: T9SS type A sorting domain-containing protein [Bacteroidales bacterium]|nr:T9SS type A sorting domain-containing protein [Bacteroidales bacterium]